MNKHPKIKIRLNKYDWFIEIIGYMLLIALWVITIASFQYLPDEIPTHYNAFGEADAFGDKEAIFTLPFIATLLFLLLSVVIKFPHTYSYAVEITEENAEKQYKNAVWLMRMLKVLITLIFFFIAYQTIQVALEKAFGLGSWFLPVITVITALILGFNMYKSKQINNNL
ncbi:MAG TPA: DUF1648 domain-containing protein [Flavobacterium sp.]|nr:DUF1648 domain-containing protein [Flavobacterium sp.]